MIRMIPKNLTDDYHVRPIYDYDMTFNGAMSARLAQSSPGKWSGQDNGWVLALIYAVVMDFNKSIVEFPNIKRSPGGASNDWRPNLQGRGRLIATGRTWGECNRTSRLIESGAGLLARPALAQRAGAPGTIGASMSGFGTTRTY